MASDPDFVQFILDQIEPDLGMTSKKMFGEFGLYSGGTFFGVVCDNQLFVKPTDEGRAFIGEAIEAPAYPGARPSFLIDDGLDDPRWLSQLVRITTRALPPPKPRKRKRGD